MPGVLSGPATFKCLIFLGHCPFPLGHNGLTEVFGGLVQLGSCFVHCYIVASQKILLLIFGGTEGTVSL